MTPVLLDQRSIVKVGITISIGMLVVFCAGFFFGHYKAVTGDGMELNKTTALALPGPAHADTTELEQQLPQELLPGAEIDVDVPDDVAAGSASEAQTAASEQAAADVDMAIEQTTAMIGKTASEMSAGQQHQPLQLASLAPATVVIGTSGSTDDTATPDNIQQAVAVETQADANALVDPEGIIDTASAEDARYTIQVGVFADSSNAIRKQSELEAQQLSSYINGYSNKKGELRFNVRFGYFNNKSSALAALNHFENHLSGSGYVARIRRK